MPELLEWGWTSCRKTGWARDDGRKLYKVKLASPGIAYCTLLFWAKHRGKALSFLSQDRDFYDLLALDGTVIN